ATARAQNGTAGAGQAAAQQLLAGLTGAIHDTSVTVDRSATQVTVHVTGHVDTLLGLTQTITVTSSGPVDKFEPNTALGLGDAAAAAPQTASDALASAGVSCASRSTRVDTGNDHPGGTVTVTLACRVDLSTVTAAVFPGSETLTASFTSPIDTYVPEPLGFGS